MRVFPAPDSEPNPGGLNEALPPCKYGGAGDFYLWKNKFLLMKNQESYENAYTPSVFNCFLKSPTQRPNLSFVGILPMKSKRLLASYPWAFR